MLRALALMAVLISPAPERPKALVEAITHTQGAQWRGDTAIVGDFLFQGRRDVAVVGRAGPSAVAIAVATQAASGQPQVLTLTLSDLCAADRASIRVGALPEAGDQNLVCPDDTELCRAMRSDGRRLRDARQRAGNSIYVDDPGCEGAVVYFDGEQLVYSNP